MSKKFCRKILRRSSNSFSNCGLLFDDRCRQNYILGVAEEYFVEKFLSSKNWVKWVHTMLPKVQFTSVQKTLWEKNSILLKKSFSANGQKCFPCVVGNICEKISWKKILFFQTLESGTLDGLITTAFHSCRGTYFQTKFLETYLNTENWAVSLWAGPIMFVFHLCRGKA